MRQQCSFSCAARAGVCVVYTPLIHVTWHRVSALPLTLLSGDTQRTLWDACVCVGGGTRGDSQVVPQWLWVSVHSSRSILYWKKKEERKKINKKIVDRVCIMAVHEVKNVWEIAKKTRSMAYFWYFLRCPWIMEDVSPQRAAALTSVCLWLLCFSFPRPLCLSPPFHLWASHPSPAPQSDCSFNRIQQDSTQCITKLTLHVLYFVS